MKSPVRTISAAAIVAAFCGAAVLSGIQPPFSLAPAIHVMFPLGNLPGLDPLVDPNTFFLIGPNQSKDLPLQLRGINFNGPAFVTTRCCAAGGVGSGSGTNLSFRIIPAAPAGVVYKKPPPPPAPNEVRFAGQSGSATLRVSSPSNVAQCGSGSPCDEGTFLVEIDAFDNRSNGYLSSAVKTRAIFAVTLMATPREGGGGCRGSVYQSTPEMLPTSQAVTSVFATKAAIPSRTVFDIGVNAIGTARGNGWVMTVTKPPAATPLTRNESIVDLTNTSGSTKSIYAVNSANCGAGAAANAIVANGQLGTIRISRTNTSTIVLSSPNVDAIAVFTEPAFWTLFGGRRVTINWFRG